MSKHRLLLADDSVTIQKVVNLTFADEGIEVITAGDGNTAMEKFVESTPDLVMVDVNMPGFDGYRICEMIKQDEETRHIPVILLVGSFEPFDEAEARRVGADDYLTKPFQSIRQLVSRVSDLLNRAGGENLNYKPAAGNEEISSNSFTNFSETKIAPDFSDFDNAGMDDEMIQTNQIGSLPVDETQKFIFEPDAATSKDIFPDLNVSENQELVETNEDLLKMDSFQLDDFQEPANLTAASDDFFRFDEKVYEFDGEEPTAQKEELPLQEPETRKTSFSYELPDNQELLQNDETLSKDTNFNMTTQPQNDALLDFDDFNFLELPPIEKKSPIADETTIPIEDLTEDFGTANPFEQSNSTVSAGEADEKKVAVQTAQLSPEIIEAIAKKVMEKLSDKVIKEIVREMTPQMTESITREMAQKNN